MSGSFSLFALLGDAASKIISIGAGLVRVESLLNIINSRSETIMLTTEDIIVKFEELKAASVAEREQVSAAIADVRIKLANIEAELAQGVAVKQADLKRLSDALDGAVVDVKSIYEPEVITPPVDPAPTEPVGETPVGQ
jgi:hypothetical protein